jgi:flagellar FliL protein
MSEEAPREQAAQGPHAETKKGRKKKLFVFLTIAVVAVVAGGVFAYMHFVVGKGKGGEAGKAEANVHAKAILVALDPFVLNLAEQGRFLKMSVQLEVTEESYQQAVTAKMPQLRDATITLLSSKSAESVAGAEGKFQLKDELLLRANQVMGKDVIRNLYFTEFIMQ